MKKRTRTIAKSVIQSPTPSNRKPTPTEIANRSPSSQYANEPPRHVRPIQKANVPSCPALSGPQAPVTREKPTQRCRNDVGMMYEYVPMMSGCPEPLRQRIPASQKRQRLEFEGEPPLSGGG